ncbi:hypothetical protein [Halorubrum sp. DM2]|uniref:hypothetical protein n=1 Tax=Halorubrum sp. DM2 TaxID=2527867 RepID=UPI0024B6563E|nr:hypothetical protein [Halorubrum sp. DM2]
MEVRGRRHKVTWTKFDLHIVRSASDGSTYEELVEHFSESGREVTGLVFALAGYLVSRCRRNSAVPLARLPIGDRLEPDRRPH